MLKVSGFEIKTQYFWVIFNKKNNSGKTDVKFTFLTSLIYEVSSRVIILNYTREFLMLPLGRWQKIAYQYTVIRLVNFLSITDCHFFILVHNV